MGGSYAEVWEYREDTGDSASDDARVEATLLQQSAKLRAVAGIRHGRKLTDDQAAMARSLVTDAARRALVPPSFAGIEDMSGARQASFSANGFQASVMWLMWLMWQHLFGRSGQRLRPASLNPTGVM